MLKPSSISGKLKIDTLMAVGALLKTTLAPWECIKRTTFELKSKIPPKTKFKKLVKLTGHTYACHSLTDFAFQAPAMNGNGNCGNLLRLV